METPHKPAQRRMSTSMLSPPESPKVYSERQNENLITSLQQENRRLTDRIHGLMIDHADYKRLIKDQEKQIAEYKSYCSAQSAQECITLKKENSNLKTELATIRARLVEYEESDVQEEVKRLKRALRSAHYTLDMLKVEKENVNPKLQKARYSDVPTAQPSALGKRKALDLSPVKTSQTAPSSPSSSTSSTSSASSASSTSSASSSSSTSSTTSTSSSTSSVDSSLTSAVIPSCSRAKSEEADPNDANSRGKKRGRDEGESPDATGFSDFESDSDIALSPPPAVIAKTEGGVTLNALEQISVIGAQVSNLESLLQQQQLRAETERRRNFDLRKEHEDLRKKNATTSSELEAKMNEVHDLQKEVQKVQNSLPKKSSIQDAVEAVSRIEEAAKTQLVEAITRHEQRLVEMTQRLHGLDQKRQQNISLLQSRLQSKAQEFHQTETQLRAQLNEKEEAMNRLQGELQRQEVESKELVQQQIASSSKADAFAQQLREHETRIEKLLAEGVQLQTKFQEQEVQVQGVRQEKDATISALQVQEVSLSKQLETALRTNESLDQRLQKAVEELGSKEEANEEFARQVNSARAANEELTKELNENRTTNLGLQSQLETSRTAYEELVGKVSQASKMNEELLQQIQSAQTSATQERTANEDLSKQTDKLAKERLTLSEEVARLGQVIQSRDSDLEAVTAKNQELVLNVATLSERGKVLEQERSSLQALLQELNGKLASVESQAGQLRKETEIEHQKLAEQHRHVQQELIQTQEQLSSSQAKLEETVKQLDTLVQQRPEMQATLAQDQRELTSLREKVSQLASTASAVVEAKTHELQRHAQFFQDHSHHALPVPEAIAAAQESSGAEEDTERTPPTPVLEHDALKPRTQPSTSPSQPRRSTRRRLSMAADENETPASSPAQVRVLFTGWKDRAGVPDYAYSIATKNQLAQIVSELGGIVPPDQEKLDKKFTHMCVPPDCRTAKSLGAALMGKYVVPPQWLIDSKTHGRFQPESAYGASTQQQLKGKVFYVSDSFKARFLPLCLLGIVEGLKRDERFRWGSREEKMVHVALKLIVTCGSGIDWSVAKDPSVACDFTLVGDEREVVPKANEPMPRVLGKLLTWDSFLDSVVVSSSAPSVPSADIVVGPSPTKDGLTVSPSETSRKRTLDSAPTPTKNPSPAKRRQAPSSPTTAPVNRRRHVPSPSSPPQRTSRSRDTD